MSPNDTLESSPHDHYIEISIVILNSFCFHFTGFASGVGNHFSLLLSPPLFTLLSPVDLFFQANAGGTLANDWVKLSGRWMRSQFVLLPPCCCCSGSADECPIVGGAGQRAVAAVVVFLLRHLPHLVPPTPTPPEGRPWLEERGAC